MIEIDEPFDSYDAWVHWIDSRRHLFSAAFTNDLAQTIIRDGFVEPLTNAVVAPSEIAAPDNNWREGLIARGLNARQRATLALIAQQTVGRNPHDVRIFGAEAVTDLALKLRGAFARFIGSEYGSNDEVRRDLFPIPHEDLEALSWPSGAFDLVTTNEVLEHVPDLDAALREMARVLKPGGWHIGTHPFRLMSRDSERKAKLVDGAVVHLTEPEYHGNPTEPAAGSLVFELPGWDILDRARSAGFAHAEMRFVASQKHGIMTTNAGVFVLCARR